MNLHFDLEKHKEDIIYNIISHMNNNSTDENLAIESQELINSIDSDVFIGFLFNNDLMKLDKAFFEDILSSIYITYTTYKEENKLELLSDSFKSMFENSNKKKIDTPLIRYCIVNFMMGFYQANQFKEKYPNVFKKLKDYKKGR
jgi:hypothetical protein